MRRPSTSTADLYHTGLACLVWLAGWQVCSAEVDERRQSALGEKSMEIAIRGVRHARHYSGAAFATTITIMLALVLWAKGAGEDAKYSACRLAVCGKERTHGERGPGENAISERLSPLVSAHGLTGSRRWVATAFLKGKRTHAEFTAWRGQQLGARRRLHWQSIPRLRWVVDQDESALERRARRLAAIREGPDR